MASDLPDDQIQQSQRPDTRILTLNLLQILASQWRESLPEASQAGGRDGIHQKSSERKNSGGRVARQVISARLNGLWR